MMGSLQLMSKEDIAVISKLRILIREPQPGVVLHFGGVGAGDPDGHDLLASAFLARLSFGQGHYVPQAGEF